VARGAHAKGGGNAFAFAQLIGGAALGNFYQFGAVNDPLASCGGMCHDLFF